MSEADLDTKFEAALDALRNATEAALDAAMPLPDGFARLVDRLALFQAGLIAGCTETNTDADEVILGVAARLRAMVRQANKLVGSEGEA